MNTMDELFEAAVDAMDRRDWAGIARLCDPASMAIYRRNLLRRVRPDRADTPLTVETLMQTQPEMPRDAAEYQVRMNARYTDPQAILQDEVPGIPDVAALEAMTAEEVFARHLASYEFDHQIERARRHTTIPPELLEHARNQPWPEPGYVLLTTFDDGDRIGYVVYRRDYGNEATSNDENRTDPGRADHTAEEKQLALDLAHGYPEFAPCRRQPDGSWRLIAKEGFLGQGSFAVGISHDGDTDDAGDG
jgi:hypothetical protein